MLQLKKEKWKDFAEKALVLYEDGLPTSWLISGNDFAASSPPPDADAALISLFSDAKRLVTQLGGLIPQYEMERSLDDPEAAVPAKTFEREDWPATWKLNDENFVTYLELDWITKGKILRNNCSRYSFSCLFQ